MEEQSVKISTLELVIYLNKTKLRRQGLVTSLFELRILANKLEAEYRNTLKNIEVHLKESDIEHKDFIVPIINKEKTSDTWEFEK